MWQWLATGRTSRKRLSSLQKWMMIYAVGAIFGAFAYGLKGYKAYGVDTEVVRGASAIVDLQELWNSATELTIPLDSELDQSQTLIVVEERVGTGTITPTLSNGELDKEQVSVYLTKQKKVETVPLEIYVKGVLAAEMPIDFHLEALKAQAIAARTYIVRRLSIGGGVGHADVMDTVQHQAYIAKTELSKRWKGEAKKRNLAKLERAIEETKGLIITYEGEPIEAVFFSTSNGYTENSEDYWEQPLPYLRSVTSPWDEALSPRYETEVSFTKDSFYRAMGLSGKEAGSKLVVKVMERTEGNRVKRIAINGKLFSGRDVRERLGLASSHFVWKIDKDGITFTTYGFGHGVGMSQWGANGMAHEAKTAEDILLHYYSGAIVEQASKLPIRTTS